MCHTILRFSLTQTVEEGKNESRNASKKKSVKVPHKNERVV